MKMSNKDGLTSFGFDSRGQQEIVGFVLIVVLVTLVAQDNEERIFYALMTAAAAYVFRPTDRVINKYVSKLFSVEPPVKSDD